MPDDEPIVPIVNLIGWNPLEALIKPFFETIRPVPNQEFEERRVEHPALRELLDNPPMLTGQATSHLDGRRVPVVIVVVRDSSGATLRGLLVELRVGGRLRDHSRTNERGIVLLRFPLRGEQDAAAAEGTVRLLLPGRQPIERQVTVPAHVQHTVVEIEPAEPFSPPAQGGTPPGQGGTPPGQGGTPPGQGGTPPGQGGTPPGQGGTSRPGPGREPQRGIAGELTGSVQTAITQAGLLPDLADNPLDRLPADFTTELCADLTSLLGTPTDPILGLVGGTSDWRTQKTPLVKRNIVPRIGLNAADDGPPRRYLVRVRQECTLLGYTLGELTEVDALDPGQVVEEVTRTLEQTTTRATQSVERATSEALSLITSSLNQLSSIDSLITNSVSPGSVLGASGFGSIAGAAVGGGLGALVGGPLGAVVGGGLGALVGGLFEGGGDPVSAATSAVNRTTTQTSLVVNSLLRTSQSTLNQAIRNLTATSRTLQRAVTTTVGQVSPLLSRVTNLFRWIVYENYLVCTHVEDIVEVRDVRITSLGDPQRPLFDAEAIVEYRRIFSPRLLEPRLRSHFDLLADAVAQQRAAAIPVSSISIDVDYAASFFGAELVVELAGETIPLTLTPGRTRASGYVRLTTPTAPGSLGDAQFHLRLRTDLRERGLADILGGFADLVSIPGGVTVSRVRLVYHTGPGRSRDQVEHLGRDALSVTTRSDTDDHAVALQPPQPAVHPEFDPLFLHVNRNRTYYFGLLAQAALREPALRDDAPELGDFDYDHELWRLPILGFEGDRVLVIADVDPEDPDIAHLVGDPGAATLVQLASPGAYGEALEGLLQLTDAAGRLHPSLLPLPAPVMPPLALVDLAGRTLQVVDAPTGGGGGGLPGGIGGGLPGLPGGLPGTGAG